MLKLMMRKYLFFVAGTRRCCNAVDVASGFMKVESVDRFKT